MFRVSVQQASTESQTTSRPTICHVIHSLGVGGAEVLVSQMVWRLSDEFRCVVAVLDDVGEIGRRLLSQGVIIEQLHRRPGIDLKCADRLRAFADREQVDILHAHQYTPFFQAMLSRGLTGQRPVVLTEHGRHVPDLPSRRRSIVNRLLLRRQDRLIACGESVRQALITNEGLPDDRTQVIYNGVDVGAMARPADDARCRIRQQLKIGRQDFVIAQVARLHELKDHNTALRTVQQVRRQVPNARLLLVGDGECRESVQRRIAELDLQSHVILTGSRSDVADLLAAADAFLLTSISEGIPLTVIEAMAAGVPIVSTSVGGLPEMIEHGVTGFLAEPGDADSLAGHLLSLYQNPALRKMICDSAAATACSKFSLDTMLDSYRRVYREVLEGAGS